MNSLASATAAWLLTYAVHSTILLGLAWAILRLRAAGAEPPVADLLWKLALVGGIVTASAQSALDLRPVGSFSIAVAAGSVTEAPAIQPPSNEPVALTDPAAEPPSRRAVEPSAEASRPTAAQPAAAVPSFRRSVLPSGVLLGAWAILALALVLWYVGRRLILVGRLGDRRMVVEGELPGVLHDLCRSVNVRPVRLTASATISSPVALGTREICLPSAALVELNPEQQRAMLAHELAHIVRRDPQWLGLACLVERVFFFQPLNRMARSGLQQSAEFMADEWAAGRSGRVPLARCLMKVAEWIQASPLGVPVAGMAEQRSQLSSRVSRLLDSGAPGRGLPRWATGLLSVGTLAAVVAFAPGASGRVPPDNIDLGGFVASPEPGMTIDPVELDGFDSKAAERLAQDQEVHVKTKSTASPSPSPSPSPSFSFSPSVKVKVGDVTVSVSESRVPQDTNVVRALMARLRDEDAEVRRAAAHSLGRIGHPMAIPDLVRTLDDADREVSRAAMEALSQFERGVPAEPIRRMLDSEDAETRASALHVLSHLRDRASVPAISKLLRDPDTDVRQHAVQALKEIGDPQAGSVLVSALSDADPEVRHEAFHAVDELKIPVAASLVSKGLGDENADVRSAALDLVEQRRMTELVPEVVRLLDDRSGDVRESAAQALSEMASEPARAALKTALNHKDPNVRRVAVEYFGEENDR